MNRFVGIGRITADLELKNSPNGKQVLNFTVAIPRKFGSKEHPEADFIRCAAWEANAKFISTYFSKGSRIAIEGRMQTESYDDNGKKRTSVECIIDNAEFVDKKSDAPAAPEQNKSTAASKTAVIPKEEEPDEDDPEQLPF